MLRVCPNSRCSLLMLGFAVFGRIEDKEPKAMVLLLLQPPHVGRARQGKARQEAVVKTNWTHL